MALVKATVTAAGILFSAPGWSSEPIFRDEMDGARPVLQLTDSDGFKILDQHIDRQGERLEAGWEIVQIQGPAGESARLTFGLPPAPVIDELQLAARVRCNRPGTQLAARVVLPRSLGSKTGVPHEILLRGSNITRGLPNERLLLSDVPKLLERQARVLRLQTTDVIDERGAYVNQIVFLVPGGNGITEFAVDCIELHGILKPRLDTNVQLTEAETEILFDAPYGPTTTSETPNPPASIPTEPVSSPSVVRRIIQWQGEEFEYLEKLGFNTAWMSRRPTAQELSSAASSNVLLVCPPPSVEALSREGIGPEWNSVLAWDLGKVLAREDLEHVSRLRQLIQQHDPNPSRSTILACRQISRDASRSTDAIMLGRDLLGSDLTLREYVIWLGQQQRLVRPGTPIWATIESELSPQRARQVAALSGSSEQHSLYASYEQLAALTAAAMSIRCRDYVFTSNSSLEASDPVTRQRAVNLELINLRLRMLTPWLATGKIMGTGHSSEPGLSAMVFQAERSHLLIPIHWPRDFRSQQAFHVPGRVSFRVPGVAETTDVYLLTLAGTKRLRHERTTGGLRIEVESLPPDGMILLTSDAEAFSQISRYLREIAPRAVKLHREYSAHRYTEMERILTSRSNIDEGKRKEILTLLNRARQCLAACDRHMASGFVEAAYQKTDEMQRVLSHVEFILRSIEGMSAAASTPLEFHIATSGMETALSDTLTENQSKGSILAGGEFEDLTVLLKNGWQHRQLPLRGINSSVRLSPESPYEGAYCLELRADSSNPSAPVSVVPTAPVWITSPPIPVAAGEIVEITGVARVPEDVLGSVDGLQVIDSLGGPGMAKRILVSPSWKPFRILRGADTDTQLTISMALSGLGRVQVDNLRVRKFRPDKSLAQQAESVAR